MAYNFIVDERYNGGYLSYSADTYDASNLLNSTFKLVDGQTAYGNLTDVYTTADQDVYSLGTLSTGYYTLDVDSYTWDWSSYGYGSVSRFQLLNSYGGVVDTSYSVYSDITFTVTTSDTYYAKIIGPSYSEEQYSIKYTKTGELLGDTTAPILTSFSLPTTVDIASGEGELVISASASDIDSGIDEVVVYFNQDIERAYSSGGFPSTLKVHGLYGLGDTWADGSSTSDWFLTETNDLGIYTIDYVKVKDGSGNEQTYYASTLSLLGYNTEFELINSAQTNYKDLYTSFSLTNDDVVDGMTQGSKWSSKVTKPLKFAISDGPANEYWYNPIWVADTVKLVFQNLESYINISTEYVGKFNNPTEAANADATIVVSLAGESMFGSSKTTWAMGHFPDASDTSSKGGDIFLNINSPANSLPSYEKGSQGYFLLLHELGHTLGLKHPHDDGGNGRPTFSQIGFGGVDFDSFTIMAYEEQIGYDQKKYDPGTPMILDVIALQYLYGINNTYNSTNTVIELSADGIYKTVWDAGGSDTVTVSDEKTAWNIVLPYYKISTLSDELAGWAESSGNDANSNANSTLIWLLGDIENVTGGAGNDIISGNLENNILVGAAGNDIIYCGKGDDTLTGGLGSDEFIFYWGDGSNIITDFDLTVDTCTFLDTTNNKLIYTESTNSKNEVEYSLSDGTSVTLQGIYGEQTYTIPSSGLSIKHTGAGAIINAPYNLSLYDEGIFVTNTGTGSTTITATGTVKGGVGQTDQTANSDGIYVYNETTTKDLSITSKDVTGLDDGICAINKGTGSLSISVTGNVTSASTDKSDTDYSYGIYAENVGTDVIVSTAGDVTSNDRGVFVSNEGSGKTNITSKGTVTAVNSGGIDVLNGDTSKDLSITAHEVSAYNNGIGAINFGTGSTTITTTGAVKGGNFQTDLAATATNGIAVLNTSAATDITITVQDVTGLQGGITANNFGTGKIEINVSGNVVGLGSESEGIATSQSESTITVLTSATVSGTTEGIKTDSKADIVTVNGSVTGLNGTAILLGGGNDTVNLGTTATITGTIDGGTGSDSARFNFSAKSDVDKFTHNYASDKTVITINGVDKTFKDFERFYFSDEVEDWSIANLVEYYNNSPNGTPKITGSAKQGEILTVDISNIADSDGLGTFSYTWLRNGSEIAGITSNAYRLAQADVGAVISVKVSYMDGQGYSETITSSSTASITGNTLPTGAVAITGNTEIGSTLTLDAGSIKDQDGLGTFNYQWLRDGSVISAANSTSYTLIKADAGSAISAKVSYTDQAGYSESVTSSGININAVSEGYIGIVGSLQKGETLNPTGGLSDADGIGTYSYQWLRDGVDISSATAFKYDLTSSDIGSAISVRVSYTDGKGNAESFTSSATALVRESNSDGSGGIVESIGAFSFVNTGTSASPVLDFYLDASKDPGGDGVGSFDVTLSFDPAEATYNSFSFASGLIGNANETNASAGKITVGAIAFPNFTNLSTPLFTMNMTLLDSNAEFAITVSGVGVDGSSLLGSTLLISEGTSFGLTSSLIPSVDENTATSTPVYSPTTTGGSNYRYSLSDTDSASFNISSSSGNVYLKTAPNYESKSSYTFDLKVSDGSKSDTETIILSVKDLNEAPFVTSTALTSVNEDTLYTYRITASDPDQNDNVSFSSASLPEWLTLNGETGLLFGTPENSDVGAHSVTLKATDTAGSITSQSFSINVVNVNDAPTGALTISGATKKGSTLTLDSSTVSDEDGLGAFTISWMRDGEVISGANSSSYVPTIDDVDKAITAKVAYTDAHGTAEAMTSSATAAIKDVFIESIGAISVVNSGTGDVPVLDFYLDSSKDPGGDGVTSIGMTLSFDPAEASFTSFSYADGLIADANDAAADGGTITFGAIAFSPVSIDKPLFTMTMKDLDSAEDFGLTVSDLNIDGSALEGSGTLIGAPKTFAVSNTVVTRDGSKISDADVVMSDGTNSSSYKSAADGSVSGALAAGSASTVTASLAYSNSTKAVSSQDGLDALKLSVGMTTAAGTKNAFDFMSADFNQDGKVSSQDALSILKYSVGLPTTEQAKWVFVDTNGDYSGVSKSNTSYTEGVTIADLSADTTISLTGILIGDVNDSYSGLIA